MKKDYDCNALLPILRKYGILFHCHHSQVQFSFYFMARTTYFESPADDLVMNVVRFSEQISSSPVWHRLIESSNLFKHVRTGSLLECSVPNVFDSISSKPLLCFGNVFIEEDKMTWLYLPRNQDFEVVLPHVARIRTRWLELTRNVASTMTPLL